MRAPAEFAFRAGVLIGALVAEIPERAMAQAQTAPAAPTAADPTPPPPPPPAAAPTEPAVPQIADDEPARELAPLPDPDGRVAFGPKPLDGRVAVITITADRPGVKIQLDGRLFGIAPQIIHTVPAGDYIVEGTLPDGRTVAQPVSVTDQPVTIHLAPRPAPPPPIRDDPADRPWHMRIKTPIWALGSLGAALLIAGAAVGVKEMLTQRTYDRAPLVTPDDQRYLDRVAAHGRTLATYANVFYGVGAVGLIAAGALAYLDVRPFRERQAPRAAVWFHVAPEAGAMAARATVDVAVRF